MPPRSAKTLQKAEAKLQTAAVELVQAATAFRQTAAAVGILNTAILNNAVAKNMPRFRIDVVKQDVEFQTMEDAKVRTNVLPDQFDEKGNLKKYTRAELAELKGKDKNLEGYESSLEKLEAGQTVKVVLTAAKKKVNPADKDKPKDDQVKDADKKMQVKMIVILAEADPDKAKKKPLNPTVAPTLSLRG